MIKEDRNIFMMNIAMLETESYILRAFTQEDCGPFLEMMAQEDMFQYLPSSTAYTLEGVDKFMRQTQQHWNERGCGWWAVQTKDNPGLIAWGGLKYLPETDETEVGYVIGRPFWGQGCATEIATAALRFGFESCGLTKIIGLTHPENVASQRVLMKAGLVYVGEFEYFGMISKKYVLKIENWLQS